MKILMDILPCKRALSRCILAVSSLPISYRCASVDALRTDVSKLCFKQSLLVSSLSVQRGGKIDFRRLSTTSLQVGGNVDLVEAAFVGSVSEPIFNGLRKKKFITGESASNVKIKPSATPLFFNSNVSIRMFCSSFYGNSWLDALKIPNETKPIIKEKLDDMERLYLEARENVKEAREHVKEVKEHQATLKLKHESDMKKLEADLSRACIDYLKLCKAFTPRGIMERFENGYRKRANVASWLKKLGLKPDRSGIWTFAAKEDSMFKKCLIDCGLDVELVPSIAECLYAAFYAQIHDSYPEITQGVDGTATMNAGCLRDDEKKVFSCLTKSFGIVVVYE